MLVLVIFVGVGLTFTPALTFAADDTETGEETPGDTSNEGVTGDDIDDEGPSFSNPAQAQHAESLSAASASEPDEDAIAAVSDAEEKAGTLEAAKEALAELEKSPEPDKDAIEAAKAAVDDAQADYDDAQALADSKMAEFAGVSTDDIAGMRGDGMGWGQIAHELGVHPGALGLGHTKGKDVGFSTGKGKQSHGTGEMTSSTFRNMKTGEPKGHGVGSGKGLGLGSSGSKSGKGIGQGGTGHGSGKENSGKGSGSSGGKGNSGGGKGGGKK
ncbi:MAG: hypothetical protein JXA03_02400 [Bacteroidales bacterium]|nr:hypothetical protein [Bacteroidales bacterium]